MCSGNFQQFILYITCLFYVSCLIATTLTKSKHVGNAFTYSKTFRRIAYVSIKQWPAHFSRIPLIIPCCSPLKHAFFQNARLFSNMLFSKIKRLYNIFRYFSYFYASNDLRMTLCFELIFCFQK